MTGIWTFVEDDLRKIGFPLCDCVADTRFEGQCVYPSANYPDNEVSNRILQRKVDWGERNVRGKSYHTW